MRKRPYAVKWKLTEEGIKLAKILSSWKEEFNEIISKSKTKELSKILESIKVRSHASHPKSAPTKGQAILTKQT